MYSSINGYLRFVHILAIMNNATVSMVVQKYLLDLDFKSLDYLQRSGVAGSRDNSIFKVFKTLHTIS